MLQRRFTGIDVPMNSVDGINAPADLLREAKELATATRKTHFVGVVEVRNPDFKEPETKDLFSFAVSLLRPDHRYLPTGEFLLSDDRDEVLAAGIGRLIWVTPEA